MATLNAVPHVASLIMILEKDVWLLFLILNAVKNAKFKSIQMIVLLRNNNFYILCKNTIKFIKNVITFVN